MSCRRTVVSLFRVMLVCLSIVTMLTVFSGPGYAQITGHWIEDGYFADYTPSQVNRTSVVNNGLAVEVDSEGSSSEDENGYVYVSVESRTPTTWGDFQQSDATCHISITRYYLYSTTATSGPTNGDTFNVNVHYSAEGAAVALGADPEVSAAFNIATTDDPSVVGDSANVGGPHWPIYSAELGPFSSFQPCTVNRGINVLTASWNCSTWASANGWRSTDQSYSNGYLASSAISYVITDPY